MLTQTYILVTAAVALFVSAAAIVAYDLRLAFPLHRRNADSCGESAVPIRWRTSAALVVLAWTPLLIALSIAVVRNSAR